MLLLLLLSSCGRETSSVGGVSKRPIGREREGQNQSGLLPRSCGARCTYITPFLSSRRRDAISTTTHPPALRRRREMASWAPPARREREKKKASHAMIAHTHRVISPFRLSLGKNKLFSRWLRDFRCGSARTAFLVSSLLLLTIAPQCCFRN